MRHHSRAVLFGGIGLLAIWLAAAASTRPAGEQMPSAAARPLAVPSDPVADDLNAQADRLNHRVASVVTPRLPGRNPFAFAPAAPPLAPAEASTPLPPLPPPPPPRPLFTLVAIGQTGDTRTAIVSAFDQVWLLKVGDEIQSRFRIAAIGADAVELIDTADSTPVRLGLR
jgi:hypothetical protein